MVKASDNAKEKLQQAKKELEADRNEVDKTLDQVKDATEDTWDDIKSGTEKLLPT